MQTSDYQHTNIDYSDIKNGQTFNSDQISSPFLNEPQPNNAGRRRSNSGVFNEAAVGSSPDPPSRLQMKHQCEQCGKIYKHRNCLSKHRWEHHEAWEATKRVCTTKHQQVQLLEAAQVLFEMQLTRPRRQ